MKANSNFASIFTSNKNKNCILIGKNNFYQLLSLLLTGKWLDSGGEQFISRLYSTKLGHHGDTNIQ